MNQARNRTVGNTLLMHAASNLHIKIVAPGWTGSCNTGIRLTSAELPSLFQIWIKQTISITLLGRRSNNKSCHLAYHAHSYLIYSGPIDTYPVLFEDIFTPSENGHLNASFQKRNPQWRFFKTLASRLRVWDEREPRLLNTMMSYIIYTTSITLCLWAMLPYFHRFSVCMRTGENDWNTLREDAYFKKYPDTCGRTGPKYLLTSNKLFPSVFNCWVHGCSRSWNFKRERSDLG